MVAIIYPTPLVSHTGACYYSQVLFLQLQDIYSYIPPIV